MKEFAEGLAGFILLAFVVPSPISFLVWSIVCIWVLTYVAWEFVFFGAVVGWVVIREVAERDRWW